MTPADKNSWLNRSGASRSIIPFDRFIDGPIFAQKDGGYGCLLTLAGVDEESCSDEVLKSHVSLIEGALAAMPPRSLLYQYLRVRPGFEIPADPISDPTAAMFSENRRQHQERTAKMRRIDLHWCITMQPPPGMRRMPPNLFAATRNRLLGNLRRQVSLLEAHLGSTLGLCTASREATVRFFSHLFNVAEWVEQLRPDDSPLDVQIARSSVRWARPEESRLCGQHLIVGKEHVQLFTLSGTPAISRPCMFDGIAALDATAVLCSVWRPRGSQEARKEVGRQEQFINFFRINPIQQFLNRGKSVVEEKQTASDHAADKKIKVLGDAIEEIDRRGQGKYRLTLMLAARDEETLREATDASHRMFAEIRVPMIEENLGNRSAFISMFPGNEHFSVADWWLGENHHARLSLTSAPNIGNLRCAELNAEYLNVLETRSGTPYFYDAFCNAVRVMLILGPPRSGKSVHTNQMVALEQKYGGYTYILDIGGSYEGTVGIYGGRVDRIGHDGPHCNPFALEATESNLRFIYTFVKLLLTNGGAVLTPEEDDTIHRSVTDVYTLPPELRRLGNLMLPRRLERYLAKWKRGGVYGEVFDNVEDSLTLGRIQCFDFQAVNAAENRDLLEPLVVWILRRIDQVMYDRANWGIHKHIVIEEVFTALRNREMLQSAIDSVKAVPKNLGGVTLIGQSVEDLGENADILINACSSFLFHRDPAFNREKYQRLFKMSDHQIRLFESLEPREALYVRQDGITKVVRLNLDPFSHATFTTRPEDRVRRASLIEKYGLREGIARFAELEGASR
jgi:type IV secretion system protein VirB4